MAELEKTSSILHEHDEKCVGDQDYGESSEEVATKRKTERRLVKKQDLTMLPLLAMCFFFGYVVSEARVIFSRLTNVANSST
jgi:hypothetical protein